MQNTSIARHQQIGSAELVRAIASNDIRQVVLLERNLTAANAFGRQAISRFKRENEELLYQTLESLLLKLTLSVNVGKNLESWQITEIAQDLAAKYHFFSIEEFILVLKKGRNGEFGKIYDRLDGTILMDWFEKYDISDERMALVQKQRFEKMTADRKENEESLLNLFSHPKMQEQVKIMQESVKVPQEFDEEGYRNFKNQYLSNSIQQSAISIQHSVNSSQQAVSGRQRILPTHDRQPAIAPKEHLDLLKKADIKVRNGITES